jgi:hypothetical protein
MEEEDTDSAERERRGREDDEEGIGKGMKRNRCDSKRDRRWIAKRNTEGRGQTEKLRETKEREAGQEEIRI